MMLTDSEQRKLNEELLDGPTTEKINKKLSAYEQKRLRAEAKREKRRKKEEAEQEERILKQLAPVVQKQQEHDGIVTIIRRKLGIKVPK